MCFLRISKENLCYYLIVFNKILLFSTPTISSSSEISENKTDGFITITEEVNEVKVNLSNLVNCS